ncbi:RNA-binding domain-containing protein [Saitoella complicata NRRL Y-17804]|uniref:RRM domain-containing protein n=1 Tax=Saitoella complicata (strain BCRC 22490 / CBS 7301 / JCM 7358 / NBRC 10748 / NRRL Y-17804) TaxID=698492 RepID=A0A0E9NFR0_SAICN|nr:RNA-binding domain-containing protein [Saitoella complicata NRRL Y-17804]ODQ52856.1 RNA-binding domain-containing protein [Saitoella complicata NRRL Y-17804]GAO48521.1 hypothetical protein G7K_2694-t1 [Saitoella complicata NRRL Y-17804]
MPKPAPKNVDSKKRKASMSASAPAKKVAVADKKSPKPKAAPVKASEKATAPAEAKKNVTKKRPAPTDEEEVEEEKAVPAGAADVIPLPEEANVEEESSDDEEEDDQTEALIKGFESSDDEEVDSSDDEAESKKPVTIALKPADEKELKQKLAKAKPSNTPGVVYLGRIPHGFYEDEMKAYFAQFGEVTRLRLSRNRKTGKSKHYAFVEFASEEVAQIVADTMNNYLLFNHILKCKLVPKDEVHENLFVGANRKFKAVPWNKIAKQQNEKPRTKEQWEKLEVKEKKRREEQQKKLEAAGIDYKYESASEKKVAEPAAAPEAEKKAAPQAAKKNIKKRKSTGK